MSLFGTMRTSISGMDAQSTRMSTVADNIANVSTTGYKRASTEFETVMGSNNVKSYTSGGVSSLVRYNITEQGTLQGTTSTTDLAIRGEGFFLVSKDGGPPYLTRAGSFVPNAAGNLVNTAGYSLMGYDLSTPGASGSNGLSGLTKISLNQNALVASPTTAGNISANLPSTATAVDPTKLPSENAANSTFTSKTSRVVYDNLGGKVELDVYFSKTADNTWEVSVFNKADAAPGGGFPYSSAALATDTLDFSPTNGSVVSGSPVSIAIPGGQTMSLDLSKSTQLASAFAISNATENGNAPSALDHIEIDSDGILSCVYQDGTRVPKFLIPLANVASPDNLRPVDGNAFADTSASGSILIGNARQGSLGSINSSTLENSRVDLGSELTTMIEAQRSYAANSKVFQGASEMMDVLMNLKA
ncbi:MULTISPECIES: flagellar hook protein FlgE [unclassified Beijerinckia]|uniref:flagellar hook protein FlgE n=1 Tax=unclassified Beijerinckia TaxID=2638183 RepID=UPI00089CF6FB|nr:MULTISPECIES: flagellar hook protein FlgE [unclassified Beijerinckia]MDH7798659.1 flagellar hook protein FlgE [Beijerinckia sp. GAS462]SED28301.1 flagellar hook protein FlgE [Beijerinckia sp. 28-YEA-48]